MKIMKLVFVTFMHHRSTVSCACVFTHMFALELPSTLSFAQVAFFVTWQKLSILRKSDDMIPSHHRVFAPFLLRHCWRPPPCSPSCLTDGTLAVRFSDICFCVWWGFSWWWRGFVGQIYRYLLLCMMRILVMVTGLSGSDFQIFGCDQTCGRRCPPPN